MESALQESAKTVPTPAPKGDVERVELEADTPTVRPASTPMLNPELEAAKKQFEAMRKAVEARSGKLNYESILVDGSITQDVSITPNMLEVTFKTVTEPQANFAFELARNENPHDEVGFFKAYALYELALGLKALTVVKQVVVLPSAEEGGQLSNEKLKARAAAIKVPVEWYRFLSYNFAWFRDRVAKAIEGSDLGNG